MTTEAKSEKTSAAPVHPLELNSLLRDAFLAGRGVSVDGKCTEADLVAWSEYEPPSKLYDRILNRITTSTP